MRNKICCFFFKNHHCNTFHRRWKYGCKSHYNRQSKITSNSSPPSPEGRFFWVRFCFSSCLHRRESYHDTITSWQVYKAWWISLYEQGNFAVLVRASGTALLDRTVPAHTQPEHGKFSHTAKFFRFVGPYLARALWSNFPATFCSSKFDFFPSSELTEPGETLPVCSPCATNKLSCYCAVVTSSKTRAETNGLHLPSPTCIPPGHQGNLPQGLQSSRWTVRAGTPLTPALSFTIASQAQHPRGPGFKLSHSVEK